MDNGPLHARIERMLRALDCDIGAAECHGMLCGMLCGPRPFDVHVWYAHLSGRDELAPFSAGEPQAALAALIAATRDGLEGDSFAFTLLLPDDGEALARRAAAFADWCRGFLSGFGVAGIADLSVLGEDARGFIADLERFGTLDVGADAGEDEERALAELTEFTRMGALIVYAETRDRGDTFEAAPGLH